MRSNTELHHGNILKLLLLASGLITSAAHADRIIACHHDQLSAGIKKICSTHFDQQRNELNNKTLSAYLISDAPMQLLQDTQQLWLQRLTECKNKNCVEQQFELRFFDLGEILGIERELFPDPWSLGQFKEELSFSPRSRYYIVLEDRTGETPRIVGYAGIAFTGANEPVDIHTLAVAKEYQGRGLGQRMLDHLREKAFALKASSILLEVRDGNEPARALYAKNGFSEISRRVGYYARFGDALVMERKLDSPTTSSGGDA